MKRFIKKSGKEVFAYEDDYADENLPHRDKKAIPNNFASFNEAFDDPGVQGLNAGDYIEIADWLYMIPILHISGRPVVGLTEALTPISFQDSRAFLDSLLTTDQKLNKIKKTVMSIFEDEIKKEKYLFGMGFSSRNIDLYQKNRDAIHLRKWRDELYSTTAFMIKSIKTQNADIDGYDEQHIRELLPDIVDIYLPLTEEEENKERYLVLEKLCLEVLNYEMKKPEYLSGFSFENKNIDHYVIDNGAIELRAIRQALFIEITRFAKQFSDGEITRAHFYTDYHIEVRLERVLKGQFGISDTLLS